MGYPPIDPKPICDFPDPVHHRQEPTKVDSVGWFAAQLKGPTFASVEEIAKRMHDAANEATRRGNEKLGTSKPTVRWEDADEFLRQGRLFMAQHLLKFFDITVKED